MHCETKEGQLVKDGMEYCARFLKKKKQTKPAWLFVVPGKWNSLYSVACKVFHWWIQALAELTPNLKYSPQRAGVCPHSQHWHKTVLKYSWDLHFYLMNSPSRPALELRSVAKGGRRNTRGKLKMWSLSSQVFWRRLRSHSSAPLEYNCLKWMGVNTMNKAAPRYAVTPNSAAPHFK